jgi:hypothetical protein
VGLKSPLRISATYGWYIGATQVTATAAELNILYGVTATAANLNILAGTGATGADLTKLHAVTADAAELNILDGVTANAAELNLCDGKNYLLNTVTASREVKEGTITSMSATATINHGMSSTSALRIHFQPYHDASGGTFYAGHPKLFTWKLSGSASASIYGWTIAGVAATRATAVHWLAMGAQ